LMPLEFLQAIAAGHPNKVKRFVEEDGQELDYPYTRPSVDALPPPEVKENVLQLCDPGDVHFISPLNWAIFAEQTPTVKYLVEKGGANPDGASSDGRRPLHIAVGKGNAEIIQWLCETHNAVINCQSGSGETPVYQAVYYGKDPVFDYLLEHGADVSIPTAHGYTALHMAASKANIKVLKYVLEKHPEMVNMQSTDGITAVMLATMAGHPEVLELLVAGGADLKLKDAKGNTALRLAILGSSKADQAQCAVWMVQNHPDIIPKGGADADEESGKLLQLACAEDDAGTVAVALIENGCSYTAINADGQTPLHTAAFNGTVGVVKALVAAGADVNGLDEDEETPSFYADLSGHEHIVEFLKQKGATYEA